MILVKLPTKKRLTSNSKGSTIVVWLQNSNLNFQLTCGEYKMTDKTFSVGGVSKTKGQFKVRFAGDMTRVKILAKTDTDINLVELPRAMTKGELVTHLKTTDLYKNPEFAAAIDAADTKYNAAPTVKVKGAKPSMDAIKARAGTKQTA